VITIVDYGLGNITAFLNVYRRVNIAARTASTADELRDATRIILPGVGHFDHAMARLEESGMRPVLDDLVVNRKVPVVGICVGMQMLAERSDEGTRPGLGWIPGHVRAFNGWEPASRLPMPHMGWNDVTPASANPLFAQLGTGARFYFLHSYFFEAAEPGHVAAVAQYGSQFACAVSAGNIHGVQFHPEKSHHFGVRLLQNFAEL